MAKTILNNEVTNAELNFMLARLRNSMVYDNKKTASVYLAGIHKQTFESLAKMGIKFDKLHHGIKMYAPNKGTKAYKTLFEGVDLKGMLAKAKEIATAATKAAKATAKAKAEKKPTAKVETPKAEKVEVAAESK